MLDCTNAYMLVLFTVDEYIAIAKEKHGYNVEQVDIVYCVCIEFDVL